MPSRNSLKEYAPHTYYHVYNRGVEKKDIFLAEQDYAFFAKLLRKYLDPSYSRPPSETPRISLARSINLLAYCLMPAHFHILLYQLDDEKALEKLFRRVMTGYVMYFNKKYRRIGPLFQGRYKASRIGDDIYLFHISRYIHLNPLDIGQMYENYPYSSYQEYLKPTNRRFIQPKLILELFEDVDYSSSVKEYADSFKARIKDDDLAFPGLS